MRSVGVRLIADVSAYMSGIKRAGAATKDFVGDLDKAAKGGQLDTVADRAAVAGLGLVGLAGTAVKLSMDFDKSMSAVSAATHASASELDLLREAALKAGKDTSYSATEAANAITELSKAGVSTSDVLGGGLNGALSLAAAGQMDVAEAAETAASAMTQFKLKGGDVPHIADLLAAAAGKAQGSVHDMGMALNQAGLVASQMGLSVEDTTGTLAAFASAGLIGSDAGTSLKTAMLMLANPTAKSKELMEELGIQVYDAQGKFVGITKLAGQLKTQLGGLTQEQRNSALATIFGSDAIRAASVLYEQGEQGIQGWIDKVNDSGYASETAAKLTDNLAGDLERLKGSLETLAIESGGGANSGLRVLAQSANALVDQLGALPPVISGGMTVLAALTGTLLLGGAAWIKSRRSAAELRTELESMGPAGERASRGLQATTKWAGRAGAAFVAMEVGATAINAAVGQNLNPQIDALATGLDSFTQTGVASGEAARLLGGDMGKLDTAMKDVADTGRWSSFARGFAGAVESFTGTGHSFDDSLTQSRERLEAIDQALSQLVSSGHGDQAAQIFSTLAERAQKQGVSIDELKKVLPGYSAALESAGGVMSGVADATGKIPGPTNDAASATKEYTSAADAAAGAARGQRDALLALSDAMKAEADPVFGLLDAQDKLAKAQRDAAKATKEHGANSTEAEAASRELAMAAIDLQGKVGALGDTFNGKLSPSMVQTLRNAGLTNRQINAVEKQFGEAKRAADAYSGSYKANVSAPGATTARNQIRNLKQELASMKTRWTVTIRQNFLTFGKPYSNPNPYNVGGLAEGGPVEGPGAKGVDSELRMLAPGEHVLTSREVDAMGGHGAVAAMRAAALANPVINVSAPAPAPQLMRPTGGGTTVQVIEHRVTFADSGGELGRLVVGAMRTSNGLTTEMKKRLGLAVA